MICPVYEVFPKEKEKKKKKKNKKKKGEAQGNPFWSVQMRRPKLHERFALDYIYCVYDKDSV